MAYNTQQLIATCENQPLLEAGVCLFNCEGNGSPINVGQPTIYNPKTGKSIDAAGVATEPSIAIGVGVHDTATGNNTVRPLFGWGVDLCKTDLKINVSPPNCGLPQIQDFYFDCTECNESYSIEVLLDDSWVRSNRQKNERQKYVFTHHTQCCSCTDCTPEHNCSDVACGLVSKINGTATKEPGKTSRFYKVKNHRDSRYQPFTAARLFPGPDTIKTFCLAMEDGDCCEKCAYIPGITGVDVDGTVTEFVNTTKPGNTALSFPSQLKSILKQLNKALEPTGGSAALIAGIGKCCPYSIQVSACLPVSLLVDGAPLAPCVEEDPFAEVPMEKLCKDCGDDPKPVKPTCGIRIYVEPIELECHCDLPPNLPEPNMYVRKVEINPVGSGWKCNSTYTHQVQKSENPEGFGYAYQHLDEYQHGGGRGRDYRKSNRKIGRFGLPDKHSRSKNLTVKCDETYCVYNLESEDYGKRKNGHQLHVNCNLGYLLVPQCDDVTKAAIEEALTAIAERNKCAVANIACDPAEEEGK